jgi:hypothetical protein
MPGLRKECNQQFEKAKRGGSMRKVIVLVLMLSAAAGCSGPQMAAFGSNSEIIIVTGPRAAVEGQMLQDILEREIVTIQYEKAFQVKVVSTGDFQADRDRKNVIFLDYFEPKDDLAGTMLDLAKSDREGMLRGDLHMKTLEDRWAKGQAVILVAAPTKEELDTFLTEQADRIFKYVSDQVQARLDRSLFYGGEQEAATRRLAETYGWSLRLPVGYTIDETYADQRVIKILKDQPARMLTVYWEGGAWVDQEASCVERKKMLSYEYWDQNEIADGTLQVSEGTFLGHDCTVLTGNWENKKYVIGGVFVTYCFTCEECGRKYVVDASIFAPGLEKLPLIREVKAILASFKCCEK